MRNYKYWIALEQTQGVGPAHLKSIYELIKSRDLSIVDIFDLTTNEIREEFNLSDTIVEAIALAKTSLPGIEREYSNLLDAGIDTILFFEELYPERLFITLKNNYPPILYSYGNKNILKERGAAILGDKDVSERGNLIAHLAAREFARHNITVISGFARGADLSAHFAALESNGSTIAIIPTGMFHLKIPEILKDVFNPDRILILSPFYPAKEFTVFNAYTRNRIICALSYVVFIVESPSEGGVFEAGKSAKKVGVPLFVTEYATYPRSAAGNKRLIDEFDAHPIRGRVENNILVPNMDKLIGIVKFAE
jgi:DNA processing protein